MCETSFGPLEIVYDYHAIANAISRAEIARATKIFGATASCCRSMESGGWGVGVTDEEILEGDQASRKN